MELRHLRYFVTAAEEQHFGRAASRLFVGRSTLSEQIRVLEREAGGPLLQRTSRRVELTEAGRLLLPEARRLLSGADHALRTVRASTAGELGSIRVGFSGVAALSGLLGDELSRFRASHPRVEVELKEAGPQVLAGLLREGVVDVAYMPDLGPLEGISTRQRAEIRPLVALPFEHRLAVHESVLMSDLAGEQIIAFAGEHDEWAATLLAGVAPDRIRAAASTLGVLALVSAGGGVALVPDVLERIAMPRVTYRPVAGAPGLAVVVAVRRDTTESVVLELLHVHDARSGAPSAPRDPVDGNARPSFLTGTSRERIHVNRRDHAAAPLRSSARSRHRRRGSHR